MSSLGYHFSERASRTVPDLNGVLLLKAVSELLWRRISKSRNASSMFQNFCGLGNKTLQLHEHLK